jgi:hypothetical protein
VGTIYVYLCITFEYVIGFVYLKIINSSKEYPIIFDWSKLLITLIKLFSITWKCHFLETIRKCIMHIACRKNLIYYLKIKNKCSHYLLLVTSTCEKRYKMNPEHFYGNHMPYVHKTFSCQGHNYFFAPIDYMKWDDAVTTITDRSV